ncbi:MAG: dihydropyrimidinase [Oscillospiraceae bacterium]|nr:dihydropyrimidinase [Oscillospiraceae bacterium]
MLIRHGTVVTEGFTGVVDLRIEGELIAEIGPDLEPLPGEEVIDAKGKLVLPGGVDVHTHMSLDLGNVVATDDFYTGTVAAACGGTTTIVDHMGFGEPGWTILDRVRHYQGMAKDKTVIDYSVHGCTNRVDSSVLDELEALIAEGVTSHKVYTTYGGKLPDKDIFAILERTAELGVMICVHPENDGVVNYLREKFVREGKLTPEYHPLSRPPETEADAIHRIALMAHMAGDAPLYIVHLTCALGLDLIRTRRETGQRRLFAETCPQYLVLDDTMYARPDGLKFIMSPPLRDKSNQEPLWQGMITDEIQTVGTDHCPFFYEKEKQLGKDDFTKAPGGAPGVEARMPIIFSEGVSKGRFSVERFVELTATSPAKLFGMYPQKGVLKPGSDGDVVIFDPEREDVITWEKLHENVDYTPYEGIKVKGVPVLTISRGKVVARDGEFVGKAGDGRFIKRGLPMTSDWDS